MAENMMEKCIGRCTSFMVLVLAAHVCNGVSKGRLVVQEAALAAVPKIESYLCAMLPGTCNIGVQVHKLRVLLSSRADESARSQSALPTLPELPTAKCTQQHHHQQHHQQHQHQHQNQSLEQQQQQHALRQMPLDSGNAANEQQEPNLARWFQVCVCVCARARAMHV